MLANVVYANQYLTLILTLCEVSKYGIFSGPYFSVFRLNM